MRHRGDDGASAGSTFADAAFLIGTHLRRIIPGSACAFYALDPVTEHLVAKHAAGAGAAGLQGLRIPLGHRLTGWVAANRQTMVNSDAALDGVIDTMSVPFRSCLSTPLLAGETLVGALTLYSTAAGGFSEDQARVVQMLAPHIADTLQAALDFESRSARKPASAAPLGPVAVPTRAAPACANGALGRPH